MRIPIIEQNHKNWPAIAARLARQAGFAAVAGEGLAMTPMAADGSVRIFFRITFTDGQRAILIAPGDDNPAACKEAWASWQIGRHVSEKLASAASAPPTPRVYAFDESSLALLCEDLGETSLFTAARALNQNSPGDRETLIGLYQQTITALIAMQLGAAAGFDPAWCCDTPVYDQTLMLERESGYFLRACWIDLLGQAEPPRLSSEFIQLADISAQAPARFFLHRDFQSRNIMIHAGRPRFIDYQGGRLGPLGYDLASLLIDPYVGLDEAAREELLDFYLAELRKKMPVEEKLFRRHFLALATQRNLQILGAFAFLSHVRGKNFFAAYLRPAVASLRRLLADDLFAFAPTLRGCAQRAENLLMGKQNKTASGPSAVTSHPLSCHIA